jgi:hypothetical protein
MKTPAETALKITLTKFALIKGAPNWRRQLCLFIFLFGILVLTAAPALSQGCSLCYTQAASSGARTIRALKIGILILIIPPTLGSIGMVFVVHRKRNQFRRDEVRQSDFNDETSPNGREDW